MEGQTPCVEALARVDGEFGKNGGPIAAWLEAHVSGMADPGGLAV